MQYLFAACSPLNPVLSGRTRWEESMRIATIMLALLSLACHKGATDLATARLSNGQIVLSVRRVASHPFLLEYERSLIVARDGGPHHVASMKEDTGGTVRINVYQLGEVLQLRDRFGTYKVSLATLALVSVDTEAAPHGLFIGSFDVVEGKWQFIGAELRKELPVDNRSAG